MKAPDAASAGKKRATAQRRATAADVALAVGVSRATVGYVLNQTPGQTISESIKQRVRAEALRLGYRPNSTARALASGTSTVVLLILPDWPASSSLAQLIERMATVLEGAGYTLVTHARHAGHARPVWDALEPVAVVGLFAFSESEAEAMRRSGVRIVYPTRGETRATATAEALQLGPRLQVAHLLERGHRRLGVATTGDPRLTDLAGARRDAQIQAARQHELPEPLVEVVDDDARAVGAVRRWLDAGVTGVTAYNDEVAARVLAAAARSDILVPGQLAVIGHDDTELAQLLVPRLSSIRLRNDESGDGLGRAVLQLLRGAAADDLRIEAPTVSVVVRETT